MPLINKQPTAQNTVEEMLKCIREGVNTEELWIQYSGHGSQKIDTNSDETDGKDELQFLLITKLLVLYVVLQHY